MFGGRFAKLLHGARRGGHLGIVRPHFRGNLGAFAGAKRVHFLQSLAQRVQYSGLGALRRAGFSGVGQHAWNAERGVQIGLRIQTVRRETNPLYYDIIEAFDRLTGCPVIVNTSFNVKDEPIVCTPEDAYRCFMKTNMDVLVMEDFVFQKAATA